LLGQNIQVGTEHRVEGDLVLGSTIKYKFDSRNDDDMVRLGVWVFKESPTPVDGVDSILNAMILQNYESAEVSLSLPLTGELKAPYG
jgi:hypothetical protein